MFYEAVLWIFLCLYCLQMIPSVKLKAENNTDLVQRGTVVQSINHQFQLRPFYVHFVHSLCGFLSGKSSFLSQTKNTRLFGVCVDGMHAQWKTGDLSGVFFFPNAAAVNGK